MELMESGKKQEIYWVWMLENWDYGGVLKFQTSTLIPREDVIHIDKFEIGEWVTCVYYEKYCYDTDYDIYFLESNQDALGVE